MFHGRPDGALAQLADAVASVGLGLTPAEPDANPGIDAFLAIPGDSPVPLHLTRVALVSAKGLQQTLRQGDRSRPGEPALRVVVADRITADARDVLRDADWGWLDLRGHLHPKAPGLFVDTNLAPLREPRRHPEPFAGRVGLEVAVAMLLEPHTALGVRQLAGQLGRAPSSVSAAVTALRHAGLVDNEGKPRPPDMFWELVSVWKPQYVDVKAVPTNDTATLEALQVNIDDFTKAGWALSDARPQPHAAHRSRFAPINRRTSTFPTSA